MSAEKKSQDAAPTETAPGTEKVTLTPEQIEELKQKAAKADEFRERMLREAADFENFKKRAARERQETIVAANERLLQKLLPVLDNFEMALAATNAPNASPDSVKKGVEMIHAQFKSTLADSGLEEVNAEGLKFDPNFHEAVSQKETTEVADGNVVQQLRRGYKFQSRLLRPSLVVVAKKPSA